MACGSSTIDERELDECECEIETHAVSHSDFDNSLNGTQITWWPEMSYLSHCSLYFMCTDFVDTR